jgi:transcription antitermination factor NusG
VRAFFPCYLFAHVDLDLVGVSCLNWTSGMRYLVGFSGLPAKLDQSVIEAIRRRLDANNSLDARGEMLEYHDRVKIAEGPFQDVEAVFDRRLSSAGRVRVLIQLLKHWTTLELEANSLRKLSQSPRTARGPRALKPPSPTA